MCNPMRRRCLALLVTLAALALPSTAAATATLPDGRVYEAVTAVGSEGHAQAYVPAAGAQGYTDPNSHDGGITTLRPFEVAPDGDALVYPGDPPAAGGGGSSGQSNGDEYLATHGNDAGWTQTDIQPPGNTAPYLAFTDDLGVGLLNSFAPLSTQAPETCEVLYAQAAGIFSPAFSETETPGECGVPSFSGASANGADLLFESSAALVAPAVAEQPNLYYSTGGHVHLVNVLESEETAAAAAFGAPGSGSGASESQPDADHAISADGARVFWTALDGEGHPQALYLREDPASAQAATRQIDAAQAGCGSCASGGGRFLTAGDDGSWVLFLDERALTPESSAAPGEADLYSYDVDSGLLSDLTAEQGGEHADVKGILGASEDGSRVYVVAGGVLGGGENSAHETATPGTCSQAGEESEAEIAELAEERLGRVPAGRACNLYELEDGHAPRFVATLPAIDGDEAIPFGGRGEQSHSGDWQAAPAQRTAEVTPAGQDAIFMSNRDLTGYDSEGLYEVFLYELDGALRCVSCNPEGLAPKATKLGVALGAYTPISKSVVLGDSHQTRGLTADGSRVFFDSAQPLVPEDENGWIDVYEWERDGSGSCAQAQGCVYLLSGGDNNENSWLLGADASGDNVFVITRAQLTGADRNENDDVYDARVDGAAATAPGGCSNACKLAPSASPSLGPPESETLAGDGNFAPVAPMQPPTMVPKPIAASRGKLLAKALKTCRATKHARRKRRRCEARARHRYAPPSHKAKDGKR